MGEGELLVAIAKIGAVVFVVGSLLSMGLSFTISQLLDPLKNAQTRDRGADRELRPGSPLCLGNHRGSAARR